MLYTYACADDIGEAYNLIKDLEPTTPQEYILKGVVNAALGQEQGSVSTGFFLLVFFVALLQSNSEIWIGLLVCCSICCILGNKP